MLRFVVLLCKIKCAAYSNTQELNCGYISIAIVSFRLRRGSRCHYVWWFCDMNKKYLPATPILILLPIARALSFARFDLILSTLLILFVMVGPVLAEVAKH